LLVLGGSIIGTEMPLTVTQILWVNLIMDTFAAMALASLPPSKDVMKDKPRKKTDFIITPSMLRGIVGIGVAMFIVLFIYLIHCLNTDGGVQIHELSMFFTTFVMLQFWNLFNAKAMGTNHSAFRGVSKDKGLAGVMLVILVGQWLIVTFGGKMFRTTPLSLTEWIYIIAGTSLALWFGELWRLVARMTEKRK
jgi:P-type Ca2+ transporter type 2C